MAAPSDHGLAQPAPGQQPNAERIHNFTHVSDLGQGNFGVAKLMLDRTTNGLVAIKIDRNVEREIINHWSLNHPNIVGFKEVFLTQTHLAIVMEYAAGGELFERIVKAGRFSEDEARYFFQQLISGVDHCHRSGVCHRDLKLENTLLDNNSAPRLKICDFGYSKSALDSQPKSTVGTPAYIAPEVLQRKEYSGQAADVWSCGVTLYVMLVGAYPFEDPADPRNFRKTIQRIMSVTYTIPSNLAISDACRDLLARIFVAAPQQRITMADIRQHPWFIKNMPAELADPERYTQSRGPDQARQSLDNIKALVAAARHKPSVALAAGRDEMEEPGDAAMGDDLHDGGGLVQAPAAGRAVALSSSGNAQPVHAQAPQVQYAGHAPHQQAMYAVPANSMQQPHAHAMYVPQQGLVAGAAPGQQYMQAGQNFTVLPVQLVHPQHAMAQPGQAAHLPAHMPQAAFVFAQPMPIRQQQQQQQQQQQPVYMLPINTAVEQQRQAQ